MTFAYLGVLVASIACMVLVDVRFGLAFGAPGRARRAGLVIAAGVVFFLVWDLAGIALGVFFRTENAISTGLLLAPELPVEELVFLAFLSYLTLVLYTAALRVVEARRARR